MTLCALSMKPKAMVSVKQEPGARSSVLVNNTQRSVIATSGEALRCKRKLGYIPGQAQAYPTQPASVARRNARERNRVKQVNNGFATLRSHIPPAIAAAIISEKGSPRNSSAASKKLSKVETLKMAVEYIRSLQQLLDEHGGSIESKSEVYEGEEERYYTSSPETVVSSEAHYYPQSPDGFSKSETSEPAYFSPTRTIVKIENNFQNFNTEVHETLTSEFYHTRSPVKTFSSPEREPPEAHGFLPPRAQVREHRGSSSLSPPMSDACPSPTPSYASDNSSIHPSSTSSSGQLSLQLSRLTTAPVHPPGPLPTRRGSPPEYERYEAISPEDEELLDVISWWQQTN